MAKTKTLQKPIHLKLRIPHIILDMRGADPALGEALSSGLDELDARFHVLGSGLKTQPHVFSLEEALEEGHMWVVLGAKLPADFKLVVDRGIVPLMLENLHPAASDYSPVEEEGNAFLFSRLSHWQIYSALVRALENFSFPYDWENLRTQGREMLE